MLPHAQASLQLLLYGVQLWLGALGMRRELLNKAIDVLCLWLIDVLYCMMKGVIS